MKKMLLKKGEIYKIWHKDIIVGKVYNKGTEDEFIPSENCIIFSPSQDIDVPLNLYQTKINSIFLITFSGEAFVEGLDNDVSTSFFERNCSFEGMSKKDFNRIIEAFNKKNIFNKLSFILRQTNYRYNRKLNSIVSL